jgi:hypothetical protein
VRPAARPEGRDLVARTPLPARPRRARQTPDEPAVSEPRLARGSPPAGRCLLAAGLTLALCALVLGQRDLLRVAVFLLVLPLAAVAVVSRTRYRLACTRRCARPGRGRRPPTVQLQLENVSRLPSGVLLMEDALPYALGGRPRFVLDRSSRGAPRRHLPGALRRARAASRSGPLSVRLTDPFGLCELDRPFASSDELVVTPVVTPLPPVRLGGDWAGGGESSSRAVSSSGLDDTATREYRYGDDLRKVHWKSSARTGELMVRQEEQPSRAAPPCCSTAARRPTAATAPARRSSGRSAPWRASASRSGAAATGSPSCARRARRSPPAGLPLTEGVLLECLADVGTSRTRSLEPAVERVRRLGTTGALVAVLGHLDLEEAGRLARLRTGGLTGIAVLWTPAAGRRPPGARGPSADAHEQRPRCSPARAGGCCRVATAPHWPRCGRSPAAAGARPAPPPALAPPIASRPVESPA